MRDPHGASWRAGDRVEVVRSLASVIVFYGLIALVVLVLGLLSYFAPDTRTGLTTRPSTAALVDLSPDIHDRLSR